MCYLHCHKCCKVRSRIKICLEINSNQACQIFHVTSLEIRILKARLILRPEKCLNKACAYRTSQPQFQLHFSVTCRPLEYGKSNPASEALSELMRAQLDLTENFLRAQKKLYVSYCDNLSSSVHQSANQTQPPGPASGKVQRWE